ncbi:MAG TPA: hypothetical protein VG122_17810, partial [Gemmata sp.]|nr:hypothetical protein [Gemmata sp.]
SAPDPARVPTKLRTFVSQQVDLFGPEKVFVFHARPFPPLNSYHRHIGYSRAVIATGLVWVVCAGLFEVINSGDAEWFAAGFTFIFLGLSCQFGFSRASGSGRPSNWQESCLVVSPGGIALVQGPLQGRMRWDELRAIELPARPRFGLASHGAVNRGVGLLVEGAYFIIADFYNRPLAQIYSRLRAYWGDRDAN